MSDLCRYSLIKTKLPREFLLLQGKGCVWKKCAYCDYFHDVSEDPFRVNKPILEKITGETGTLDVINSGSAMELDSQTIELLQKKVIEKNIHTIWFEAHWIYHKKLDDFAKLFPSAKVKFRIGVETFDSKLRMSWNKGISNEIDAKKISEYFSGACLLIGVEGQTKDAIKRDIRIAKENFEYFSVNAFVENSTPLKRDNELVEWFVKEIFPQIKDDPPIEVLINNTDLGVG